MKVINSSRLAEKMLFNSMRVFTERKPDRIIINERFQCMCRYDGNFKMYINCAIKSNKYTRDYQWSLAVGGHKDSVLNTYSYFCDLDPIKYFIEAISFYITVYEFEF